MKVVKLVNWAEGERIEKSVGSNCSVEACAEVVKYLKEHNLKYGGYAYQSDDFEGVPVFDTGECYMCTLRAWGEVVADAFGGTYIDYAWCSKIDNVKQKTVFNKHVDMFGDTCKWLECDDMFHANQCMLKRFERYYLHDTFEKNGFKYPLAAENLISLGCDCSPDCHVKTSDRDEVIDKDEYGFETTKFEKSAEQLAKEKYPDDVISEKYREGLLVMISNKMRDLHKIELEIGEMQRELQRVSKDIEKEIENEY